jgi:predicted DNA-binding transcriptional regulator AlpA
MAITSLEQRQQELLTEHEVAALLKLSVATIRRRRLLRQPPDFLKIGSSVRYRRKAIERLIDASEQHMEAR